MLRRWSKPPDGKRGEVKAVRSSREDTRIDFVVRSGRKLMRSARPKTS